MNIFVVSEAAWNTSNSVGNTLTNWFANWPDTNIYHFYARHQNPDTDIVNAYYRVSALEVLKCAFTMKNSGSILNAQDVYGNVMGGSDNDKERQLITKLHKSRNELVYWCMEQIWLTKKWMNQRFASFLEDHQPDILFAFATSPYVLAPMIEYIKRKKINTKIVLYIADDVLSGFSQHAWFRKTYLKKKFDYCISQADKLYGASVEMAAVYADRYKKPVTPLYKGCAFELPIRIDVSKPIKIVYAGNLLFGRDQTIACILSALKRINSVETKVVMEVYSNMLLTTDVQRKLFDEKNVFFRGTLPYQEIKKVLNSADIVVHIESFNEEKIKEVKYSFSTKIIDCLQSGSYFLGIGPKGISSIEYIRKIPGTTVIDSIDGIADGIENLVMHPELLVAGKQNTRAYAEKVHSIDVVRKGLQDDFLSLLN